MDFIEVLPPSHGFNSLWVVVDRLTKYGHFIPITHPCSAKVIAQLFAKHVMKLYGMPHSIFYVRDNIYQSLYKLGIRFTFSFNVTGNSP